MAVGVDAGDAADDPVAHNGPDLLYVPAFSSIWRLHEAMHCLMRR